MISPNEFWLQVHRLSSAHDAEGETPKERTQKIVDQFQEMAPISQREMLEELTKLMVNITDVYTLVSAAAKNGKQSRQEHAKTK